MARHLFICGCPRSGTTILTNTLNRHPAISLGIERYLGLVQLGFPITPDLFDPDRFLDIRNGDTFYQDFSFFAEYAGIEEKYPTAAVIGDKVPIYYEKYDQILENFPDAKIVFIVRNIFDVAVSYKQRAENSEDKLWSAGQSALAAIPQWNNSLTRTLSVVNSDRVLAVAFEDLFLRHDSFAKLSDFLGLDLSSIVDDQQTTAQRYGSSLSRKTSLTSLESEQIAREADFVSYRKLLGIGRGAEQVKRKPSLLQRLRRGRL